MSVQPETEWLQQFFDGKPLPDTKLFQVYAKLRSLLTTTPNMAEFRAHRLFLAQHMTVAADMLAARGRSVDEHEEPH